MKNQLKSKVETYSEIIKGGCSCGEPVLKIIASNVTNRTDKIRFAYPDDNEGWCIFRCQNCRKVIDENFQESK